jgi:hypothetical protein
VTGETTKESSALGSSEGNRTGGEVKLASKKSGESAFGFHDTVLEFVPLEYDPALA